MKVLELGCSSSGYLISGWPFECIVRTRGNMGLACGVLSKSTISREIGLVVDDIGSGGLEGMDGLNLCVHHVSYARQAVQYMVYAACDSLGRSLLGM